MKIKFFGLLAILFLSANSFGQALNYQQALQVPVAGTFTPVTNVMGTKAPFSIQKQGSEPVLNLCDAAGDFCTQLLTTTTGKFYVNFFGSSTADVMAVAGDIKTEGGSLIAESTLGNQQGAFRIDNFGNLELRNPLTGLLTLTAHDSAGAFKMNYGTSGAFVQGGSGGDLTLSPGASKDVYFGLGSILIYRDVTNTYATEVVQGVNGWTITPNTLGKGFQLNNPSRTKSVFWDQNDNSFDVQTTSAAINIDSTDPTAVINLGTGSQATKIASVAANTIPVADGTGNLQGLALTAGKLPVANSSGVPVAGSFSADLPITITDDGLGNKSIKCPTCDNGGGNGTAIVIPVQLVANSTEQTVNVKFTSDGLGRATITIPTFTGLPVVGIDSTITTTLSSVPNPIPAAYCPAVDTVASVVVSSGGTVQNTLGQVLVLASCNIEFWYMPNTNLGFPVGTAGVGAFTPGNQTASYNVSPATPVDYRVVGSGTGGTVTPSPQYWEPLTSTMSFSLTPSGGNTLYSSTDTCGPLGAQLGSIVGANYVIPSSPSQNCTVSIVFAPAYAIATSAGAGGTISPTSAIWYGGITSSIPFTVTPDTGYVIDTVTDNCDGGTPGGSGSSTYTLTTVNQACTVTATFTGATVSTSNVGFGSGTFLPSSATYAGSPLSFTPIRASGNRLNPYSMTDNCNSGSQSGAWNSTNTAYVVPVVTGNCTVQGAYLPYDNFAYVDIFATGSLAAIPVGTYAKYSGLIFGFIDPTTATMAAPQVTAIINAVTDNANINALLALGLGGEGYNYTTLNGIGFATVISNAQSQMTQVNAALVLAGQPPLDAWDLDLEGSDWPSDGIAIDDLATGLAPGGYLIMATPQASSSGGDIGTTPNVLTLTAGGTVNNYGLALSLGHVNYINVQTYNFGAGLTCNGNNESTTDFSACISTVLNKLVQPSCSGPNPLCISSDGFPGTNGVTFNITQVANARAGCYTIFNQSWCPAGPIPSYSQSTILGSLATQLTLALNSSWMNGITLWALNYDYAASLYTPPDNFSVDGAFTDTIVSVPLFSKKKISEGYPSNYKDVKLRGVRYDVVSPTRERKKLLPNSRKNIVHKKKHEIS